MGKGGELGTVAQVSLGESGADRVENAVEQHERGMEADGRVSARIHQPEFRAFWKDELKADTWTLAVLADGYAPPWSKTPEQYREPNNRSAQGEQQFVWDTVQAWVHQGAVEVTAGPATCVSPLTVALAHKPDGSTKKRLCLDGSRYINLLLPRESFRMTTVQLAAEMIEEGDWQFTYDLESAYFHVMIAEKDRDYLGFAAVNPATGVEAFFRFRVMPFGLATAARTMTRMTKPVVCHLASKGVRHVIYIDDGRVLASSEVKAYEDYALVLSVLERAGFTISVKKTDRPEDIAQSKQFLGFVFNTVTMSVSLPDEKVTAIIQKIRKVVDNSSATVCPKKLASVVGSVSSVRMAIGKLGAVFLRSAHTDLGLTEEQGWRRPIPLGRQTVADLSYIADHLSAWNGHPIPAAATAVSLTSLLDYASPALRDKVLQGHSRSWPTACMVGDASGTGMCAFSVQGLGEIYVQDIFTEEEQGLSSGHRELLTVQRTLEQEGKALSTAPRPRTIYWLTDSTNMVSFLSTGSAKPDIQKVVVKIFRLCQEMQLNIEPVHITRDDPLKTVADAASRYRDVEDWGIDFASFRDLEARFGKFSIDLFASEGNHKVDRFYANVLTPSGEGVDAFAHSWDGEHAFASPPMKDVIKTFRKMMTSTMTGVLVVPEWRSASFWAVLFPDGDRLHPRWTDLWRFKPFILSGPFSASPVLQGFTPFAWRALYWQS